MKDSESLARLSELEAGSVGSGGLRTFFVFKDLPRHVEFHAGRVPLIPVGESIHMDIELRSPRDRTRTRKVEGLYVIGSRTLRYSAAHGLTQYLELDPVR